MSDADITPILVGKQEYEVTGSKNLIADLWLAVDATGTSFQVEYPADASGVGVRLVRGSVGLELLPGPVDDPPLGGTPTFTQRRVRADAFPRGSRMVLTATIQALSGASSGEAWTMRVSGLDREACQLRQYDNNPAQPTITRLICDPDASFDIGGEAEVSATRKTVKEKCSVWLSAGSGVNPGTVVKAPSAPDPLVRYDWTAARDAVAGLPASGRKVRFFAPGVAAERNVSLSLRVRLDAGAGGVLEDSENWPLTVRPLAGRIEIGPEIAVAPGAGNDFGVSLRLDRDSGLVVVWTRNPPGGGFVDMAARLDCHDLRAGFSSPIELGRHPFVDSPPDLALLPNGDWVAVRGAATEDKIVFRRGPFERLAAAPDREVATTAGVHHIYPRAVVSGGSTVFVFGTDRSERRWRYRRYRHATDVWEDATAQPLSDQKVSTYQDFAATPSGHVWVALEMSRDAAHASDWVRAFRLNVGTGAVEFPLTFDRPAGVPGRESGRPVLLPTAGGPVYLFWYAHDRPVQMYRFAGGAWQGPEAVANTQGNDWTMAAFEDSRGGLLLFVSRWVAPRSQLLLLRRDPASGAWSQPAVVNEEGDVVGVVKTSEDTLWVVRAGPGGQPGFARNLFCRRILTHL